jgi:glycosyltransferase involved in cell wall biosynthesis
MSAGATREALPNLVDPDFRRDTGAVTAASEPSAPGRQRPLVSVVIEGYNESRALGTATNTVDALSEQDFPLDRVEVVLVGAPDQVSAWLTERREHPFYSVKPVPVEDAHYYELKNLGAEAAGGEIVAFTDSDVFPRRRWLSAIVEGFQNGADATCGPSLFKGERACDTPLLRQVAASITWGWIVGPRTDGRPRARGFMDHNLAVGAGVLRRHPYRTDLGRVLASPLLYRALVDDGRRLELQVEQQAVHYFDWRYWLSGLHFRYGFEVYQLRRMDPQYPNRWIMRTWVFEPVVTMGWHMLLDLPRWWRFGDTLGFGLAKRIALYPALIVLSALARGAEAAGMYGTLIAPERMRRWAETV